MSYVTNLALWLQYFNKITYLLATYIVTKQPNGTYVFCATANNSRQKASSFRAVYTAGCQHLRYSMSHDSYSLGGGIWL